MSLEPRANWFSPKCVEAQRLTRHSKGKIVFQCDSMRNYKVLLELYGLFYLLSPSFGLSSLTNLECKSFVDVLLF